MADAAAAVLGDDEAAEVSEAAAATSAKFKFQTGIQCRSKYQVHFKLLIQLDELNPKSKPN